MISTYAKFTICSYPYNYIIIEDCFETSAACGLSSVFNDLIRTGRPVGKVGEVGDLVYDALNFTPKMEHVKSSPFSSIASTELKNLIAEVFDIYLNENLMIGMHRHNPPSKPGWTHTDFAIVSFPNIPVNYGGNAYTPMPIAAITQPTPNIASRIPSKPLAQSLACTTRQTKSGIKA